MLQSNGVIFILEMDKIVIQMDYILFLYLWKYMRVSLFIYDIPLFFFLSI